MHQAGNGKEEIEAKVAEIKAQMEKYDKLVRELIMRDAEPKTKMRGFDSIILEGFARSSATYTDSNWDNDYTIIY